MHLDKSEDFDFKYDNNFSKIRLKNTQKKHFWSQSLGYLILHEILLLGKFEDVDFINYIKYPKSGIFDPKFKYFYFCTDVGN